MIVTSSPVNGLVNVTVTAPVPGDWVERAVCYVTILNTDFRLMEELVLNAGTGNKGTVIYYKISYFINIKHLYAWKTTYFYVAGLPSPLRSSARSSSFQAVILVLLVVSQWCQ